MTATSLALSLLAGTAPAQDLGRVGSVPDPATAPWSRTYGGSVNEQGLHDLAQLPGGRLVVAGYTASFGGPTQSSWLMQLDLASGDVQSQQVSSSAFGGFTDGACIAADGGALFVGRDVLDIFVKHDAWLMRVDATGTVVWSQGFTRPGFGRHFLHNAAELADGSWIAAGATGILDEPPQAGWLVRLSSTGVPLWHYEYGAGLADSLHSVTLTADGGFAVAGATNSSGAGGDDVWVMKLDSAGAIEWQKTFGGKQGEGAEQIVALDDGGFAVVGSTNSLTSSGHAPFILRLDADGGLLWHSVVASGVWGDLGGVAQAADGTLAVLGRVWTPGARSNDLWCAELSAEDGNVLWQRAYRGDSGDYGSAVLPLNRTGFVLGGTWAWGLPGESIWLQRTDDLGLLPGCKLAQSTTFALTSPKITEGDGLAVRVPGGAVTQAVAVQHAPSDAVVIDVCR
ncbi:MAG: hypothetical protein ACYTG2_12150 [Planctomycetota bacterium]|jgi:hypothetical protein